jgi:hypothetical protein
MGARHGVYAYSPSTREAKALQLQASSDTWVLGLVMPQDCLLYVIMLFTFVLSFRDYNIQQKVFRGQEEVCMQGLEFPVLVTHFAPVERFPWWLWRSPDLWITATSCSTRSPAWQWARRIALKGTEETNNDSVCYSVWDILHFESWQTMGAIPVSANRTI